MTDAIIRRRWVRNNSGSGGIIIPGGGGNSNTCDHPKDKQYEKRYSTADNLCTTRVVIICSGCNVHLKQYFETTHKRAPYGDGTYYCTVCGKHPL